MLELEVVSVFDQLARTKCGRRQLRNLMTRLGEAATRTKRKFDSATEDEDFPRRMAYLDLFNLMHDLHGEVFETLYPEYAQARLAEEETPNASAA